VPAEDSRCGTSIKRQRYYILGQPFEFRTCYFYRSGPTTNATGGFIGPSDVSEERQRRREPDLCDFRSDLLASLRP
jgi:hypothetical protein